MTPSPAPPQSSGELSNLVLREQQGNIADLATKPSSYLVKSRIGSSKMSKPSAGRASPHRDLFRDGRSKLHDLSGFASNREWLEGAFVHCFPYLIDGAASCGSLA